MKGRYVVRIDPRDVGKRVTIRVRVPAGPGEPTTTDVVGMLRRWDEGTLEIVRKDGTVEVLDERRLLAGRVVEPPR